MSQFHRQCDLIRGSAHTTAWLPEEFARSGKMLALKIGPEKWEDGWRVHFVGPRLETSVMLERSRDWRHTREASDI